MSVFRSTFGGITEEYETLSRANLLPCFYGIEDLFFHKLGKDGIRNSPTECIMTDIQPTPPNYSSATSGANPCATGSLERRIGVEIRREMTLQEHSNGGSIATAKLPHGVRNYCGMSEPKLSVMCSLYDLATLVCLPGARMNWWHLRCGHHHVKSEDLHISILHNLTTETRESRVERQRWLARAVTIFGLMRVSLGLDRHTSNLIVAHTLLEESRPPPLDVYAPEVFTPYPHKRLRSGFEWLWWQHRSKVGKQPFPAEFWQIYFDTRAQDSRALHYIPLFSVFPHHAISNIREFKVHLTAQNSSAIKVCALHLCEHPRSSVISEFCVPYVKWSTFRRHSSTSALVLNLPNINSNENLAVPLETFHYHVGIGFLFCLTDDVQQHPIDVSDQYSAISLYVRSKLGLESVLVTHSKLEDLCVDVCDLPQQKPSLYCNSEKMHESKNPDSKSIKWYFLPTDSRFTAKEAIKLHAWDRKYRTLNLSESACTTLILQKNLSLARKTDIEPIICVSWRHFNILVSWPWGFADIFVSY